MPKRVLAFGSVFAVLAAALFAILAAVDWINAEQLREGLGRTLLVIAISTAAVAAILGIGRRALTDAPKAPEPRDRTSQRGR